MINHMQNANLQQINILAKRNTKWIHTLSFKKNNTTEQKLLYLFGETKVANAAKTTKPYVNANL